MLHVFVLSEPRGTAFAPASMQCYRAGAPLRLNVRTSERERVGGGESIKEKKETKKEKEMEEMDGDATENAHGAGVCNRPGKENVGWFYSYISNTQLQGGKNAARKKERITASAAR